ncbi:hypothetical protein, partial [Brucella melitensis]|uniref:hypothetical protein n=1 Tax=Brucella melitensis TaxID=29459 RepID=UPI0032B8248F
IMFRLEKSHTRLNQQNIPILLTLMHRFKTLPQAIHPTLSFRLLPKKPHLVYRALSPNAYD